MTGIVWMANSMLSSDWHQKYSSQAVLKTLNNNPPLQQWDAENKDVAFLTTLTHHPLRNRHQPAPKSAFLRCKGHLQLVHIQHWGLIFTLEPGGRKSGAREGFRKLGLLFRIVNQRTNIAQACPLVVAKVNCICPPNTIKYIRNGLKNHTRPQKHVPFGWDSQIAC